MSRSRFPRWSDLRPPHTARPLTVAELQEHQAVRLALILALGVLQAGSFAADHQPLSGDYIDHHAWLRQVLEPLARRSPTVALARRLINLAGPTIRWDEGRVLRRDLLRLAIAADRLSRQRPGVRS